MPSRSVIETGQAVLKTTILINGGGALAVFVFLGHIYTHPYQVIGLGLTNSFSYFIFGVLAGAIAFGTTFLAQFSLVCGRKRIGNFINIISIILVLTSLILFFFGCRETYRILNIYFLSLKY